MDPVGTHTPDRMAADYLWQPRWSQNAMQSDAMDTGAQSKALVSRHMANVDTGFCQIARYNCEDCEMGNGLEMGCFKLRHGVIYDHQQLGYP